MEFSRQEFQSGWPFSFPGVFSIQGSNPGLPHCGWMFSFLPSEPPGDLPIVREASTKIEQDMMKPRGALGNHYPIPSLLCAHRDNFYRLAPRNIINISQLSIQLGMTTSCSVAQSCLTLCDPMDCSRQASLSFTIPQNLLKLMFIELVMPSNHLVLCHPLLLSPSSLQSFPASGSF